MPAGSAEVSERTWRLSAAAILIVGAVLRLYQLSLVPLHHDEGVNGNFLVTLVRERKYFYDPQNYHGPTLYYFSAIIGWIARFFGGKTWGDFYGLNDQTIRGVTALFGIATIWLVLTLRKRLGTIGALSAAGLIAISPGAVYLSRYFIHEPLFVFFTLGIVVAALKYYDTGQSVYLILASLSAGLMVATKETWIINLPVLLIALLTTSGYFWLRQQLEGKPEPDYANGGDGAGRALARFGGPIPVITAALIALTVFIVVVVLFYSSFFKNYPKGVSDAFQTLNLWRKRTDEHAKPFLQYFEWLRQMEVALLLLGAVGAMITLWSGRNRFALFSAQWAFGLLVAYSLVKYKTPWISLNFIVPLAIISGYAFNQLYKRVGEPWVPLTLTAGTILLIVFDRFVKLEYGQLSKIPGVTWEFDLTKNLFAIAAILLLAGYAGYIVYARFNQQRHPVHFYVAAALALSVLGYQMYQLNFVHYDDDRYPYVYAHTRREFLTMLDEVDRIARRMGTGQETGIALVSPDYWPMPWYFRDYKRVGYYQKVVPTTEPIIIGSTTQKEELETTFGDRYQLVNSGLGPDGSSYTLRPGVDLLLYVRKDVAK